MVIYPNGPTKIYAPYFILNEFYCLQSTVLSKPNKINVFFWHTADKITELKVCCEQGADIVLMWKTGGFSIRFSALLDYINDLQHLVLAPQQFVALDDADFFFPTLLVTIRYMPAC